MTVLKVIPFETNNVLLKGLLLSLYVVLFVCSWWFQGFSEYYNPTIYLYNDKHAQFPNYSSENAYSNTQDSTQPRQIWLLLIKSHFRVKHSMCRQEVFTEAPHQDLENYTFEN